MPSTISADKRSRILAAVKTFRRIANQGHEFAKAQLLQPFQYDSTIWTPLITEWRRQLARIQVLLPGDVPAILNTFAHAMPDGAGIGLHRSPELWTAYEECLYRDAIAAIDLLRETATQRRRRTAHKRDQEVTDAEKEVMALRNEYETFKEIAAHTKKKKTPERVRQLFRSGVEKTAAMTDSTIDEITEQIAGRSRGRKRVHQVRDIADPQGPKASKGRVNKHARDRDND